MDSSLFDECSAAFAEVGATSFRVLSERVGPGIVEFRGRGWQTVRWGDLLMTLADDAVESMLLEGRAAPAATPLIPRRLLTWIAGVTNEQDLLALARQSRQPTQAVTESSWVELRCENGFAVLLSDGVVGCTWRRGNTRGP